MAEEYDPNADLIGYTFDSEYRGQFPFRTEVIETAHWNPAYVIVRVTRDQATELTDWTSVMSSRPANQVRDHKRRGGAVCAVRPKTQ